MSARRHPLYARLAIPLVILLFVFGLIAADLGLAGLRLDLTDDRRFTLSRETAAVLAGLEEPIALRFYASSRLTDVSPAYADLRDRTAALLAEMQRLGGENLAVEVVDPAPYTAAEDRAVAEGIRPIPAGDGSGDFVYFGLAAGNAVDQRQAVAFLNPERAGQLEYDLVSLVAGLAQVKKPVVGLWSSLPLDGNPLLRQPPQSVLERIRRQFALREIEPDGGRIPADLDLLMVVQPSGLDPASAYALDQFIVNGGRVLLFLDPYSEQQALMNAQRGLPPLPPDFAPLAHLLAAWGLKMSADRVAADRRTARQVVVGGDDGRSVTDYVVWLSIPRDRMAADQPVVQGLSSVNLNSAGYVETTAEKTLPWLMRTSAEAEALPVDRMAINPDPAALLANYSAGGSALILAAAGEGPVESVFPAGPPAEVRDPALAEAHRAAGTGDSRLVVVADSDLLFDNTWIGGRGGEAVPLAGNGAFVVNALEWLAGLPPLGALRGRGVSERPFTVIEDLRREAELQARRREQALMRRIAAAEQEIGALERTADGGVVLSAEQRAAVDDLRAELLAARQDLRGVERRLRAQLDGTLQRIQLVNILAVPALVALVGLLVVLIRRRRALGPAGRRLG